MKKYSLKKYCIVLIGVIVVGVFADFLSIHKHSSYSMVGEESLKVIPEPEVFAKDSILPDGKHVSYHAATISFNINVQPKHTIGSPVLISEVNGKQSLVEMESVVLKVPTSEARNMKLMMVIHGLILAIALGLYVWLLIVAYKLIKSVIRGEVFVTKVARLLKITGRLLILIYVVEFLATYGLTQYYAHTIQLATYDIVFVNECDTLNLVLGVLLELIATVVLMGKDLKEEQELTI